MRLTARVEIDGAADEGAKDYISEVRESSLGSRFATRTAGSKCNNAQFYGKFAALWFFLIDKKWWCKSGSCSSSRVAQSVL